MKKIVTMEQIQKIIDANNAVRGTYDYMKYYMCFEYKYRNYNNKWTGWKFMRWTIPTAYTKGNYYLKTIKDRTFLMFERDDSVERFEVNTAVKELLGI